MPTRWDGLRRVARSTFDSLNLNGLTRTGTLLVICFAIVAAAGPYFAMDPATQTTSVLQPPTWDHLFGTDHLGRDLLARSLAGARVSLLVAITSVGLGLLISLPIGLVAGYAGGTWIDDLIMGAVDVLLALPLFLLALFVLGLTGTGDSQLGPFPIPAVAKVVFLIALAATPLFARVARAATLVERQEAYVDALRVTGASRLRIISRELLINVLPPVMVLAFLWMAIAIFAEAALSFLGLGVQPPDPTLGNILADANNYLFIGAWWYSLFPGGMLVLAIVGLNLLGDGLSEMLDFQVRS